jgi:hypothetical protein
MNSNRIALVAAAGILTLGAGWAATLYFAPPKTTGPDPAQLRRLAAHLQDGQAPGQAELPLLLPGKRLPAKPGTPSAGTTGPGQPALQGTGPRIQAIVPRQPGTPGAPGTPSAPTTPGTPAAPSDPLKSIALTGVTHESGADRVWLVNIDSRDRETAAVGQQAFGFKVKAIHPDRVVLERDGGEHVLRLGEKQVPALVVASAETPGSGESRRDDDDGDRGRGGRGDRGDRDGRRDWSGGDRSDFMRRIEEARSRYASFGGGSSGSGSYGWGDRSRSDGDRSRSDGDRGSSDRWRSRSSSSGGSSTTTMPFGGGYPYWMGRSRDSGSQSQFATGAAGPASNPQTARRRGVTVTGGSDTMPFEVPEPINNPQTARRLGTASGPAFGQDANAQAGQGYGGRTSTRFGAPTGTQTGTSTRTR